jgi:uncharacterized membrane protein YqhA
MKSMRRLLESVRYMVVVAVLGLLAGALLTFGWGAYEVFDFGRLLVNGEETKGLVAALQMIDTFLLATVILVFAVGLWELFVSDLDLPDWLEIHSLDDLKRKLTDVIVLVVAIKSFEKLTAAKKPLDALIYAGAGGLIIVSLVLSSAVQLSRKKQSPTSRQRNQGNSSDSETKAD